MKLLRKVCLTLACAGLLCAPVLSGTAATLNLPDGLTAIEAEAFAGDASISFVKVPEGTETIGSRAFADSGLTAISLPDSLSSIADDAFEGCSGLTVLASEGSWAEDWCADNGVSCLLPTAVSDFTYTVSGGEATITRYKGTDSAVRVPAEINGSPVTAIGASAFYNNSTLTAVYLPDSVKTVGTRAFRWCYALKTFCSGDGLTSIGDQAFEDCNALKQIDLPDSLTSIGASAFYDSGLTSVVVPAGVTELGNATFRSCSALVRATLPEGLTAIGDYAFSSCTSLAQVNLPSTLTSIGSSAFYSCSKLTALEVPKGVTTIGGSAFSICSALETITLPTTVSSIGTNAFYGCSNLTATVPENSYAHSWFVDNGIAVKVVPGDFVYTSDGERAVLTAYTGSDSAVTVPETLGDVPVTEIAARAFQNNAALVSVTIPDAVTSIGHRTFEGCASLQSVHMPESLTSIGGYCFKDCASLTEISIPDDVMFIGNGAFEGCSSLATVYATAGENGATVISLYGLPFIDASDETLQLTQTSASGALSLSVAGYLGDQTELTLPTSLNGVAITAIADGAFEGGAVSKVVLSEGLGTIGSRAFADSGLTRINLPASLTEIADDAFDGCEGLIIAALNGSYGGEWCADSGLDYYLDTDPNEESDFTVSVLSSTACAITGYTGERTVVVLPEKIGGRTVTTVAQSAFMDNEAIESVTIPGTVTTIEAYAFYDCVGLTRVTLGDGVKNIREQAFYGCRMEEIVFPDSVTTLESCLGYNTKLVRATLPSGLTSIPKEMFKGCQSLTEIEIPAGVTEIKAYAFQGAGLTSVTIPGKVKTIGAMAFYNCFNLKTAYLPTSVKSIGADAFPSSVEIHCAKGSTAAEWATDNGNTVVYD